MSALPRVGVLRSSEAGTPGGNMALEVSIEETTDLWDGGEVLPSTLPFSSCIPPLCPFGLLAMPKIFHLHHLACTVSSQYMTGEVSSARPLPPFQTKAFFFESWFFPRHPLRNQFDEPLVSNTAGWGANRWRLASDHDQRQWAATCQ